MSVMSDRKLVSVITGTYDRPRELKNAIESIRAQTYPNIEHCIVHDGPASDEVREVMGQAFSTEKERENIVRLKWLETGRQWSQFLANSISAVPYQVAQWLSSGDYLMWLADDEEVTPDHIELLVNLLEAEDVDFVYSKTEIWFNPRAMKGYIRKNDIIGKSTPTCGNITQALFRAELLDYRGFMTHVGSGTDWDQVSNWMDAGASWAFLDQITHTHRVDKFGDSKLNKVKQTLRGSKNK